jgi:hypothetical protein
LGVENLKKREKTAELQFKLRHPFNPKLTSPKKKRGNSTGSPQAPRPRTPNILTEENINRLAYKDPTKAEILNTQNFYLKNFDQKTGQKLFAPNLPKRAKTPNPDLTPLSKKGRSWGTMEYLRIQKKDFYNKCRQIFTFLDWKNENFIKIENFDYLETNPVCLGILTGILVKIVGCKSGFGFEEFVAMVVKEGLVGEVDRVFVGLQKELMHKYYKDRGGKGSSWNVGADKENLVNGQRGPGLGLGLEADAGKQGKGGTASFEERNYISPNYRRILKKQIL